MNCPEEWDNKEYQETISKIIRITRAAKKSIAVHWSFNKATERQLKWIDEGANMVLHSSDIKLFNNTMKKDMSKLTTKTTRSKNQGQIDAI